MVGASCSRGALTRGREWDKLGALTLRKGRDMRDKRTLIVAGAAVVVVAALAAAFALGAFRSDADRARDVATELLESYVVPEPDEDGNESGDGGWPAADFGDAATMEALVRYGVDADAWHRHCFGNFSFEVGEASTDGDSASVSLTVTNASLSSAVSAAGADFAAYAETSEAQDAYAAGGRAALFSYLVERVYAHLDANESPVTTTVSLPLTRGDDGGWVPSVSGNAEFFSALYGGSDVIAGLSSAAE